MFYRCFLRAGGWADFGFGDCKEVWGSGSRKAEGDDEEGEDEEKKGQGWEVHFSS